MKTKYLLKQMLLPILCLAVSFNLKAATGTLNIGGITGQNLATNAGGTGWTWTANSETLSLTSAYGGEAIAINSQTADHIKLVYTGDVTVSSTSTDAIFCNSQLTINGSGGTLTARYIGDEFYGGLVAYGLIAISSGTIVGERAGAYTTGTLAAAAIYGNIVTIDGSATVVGTAIGGGNATGILGNTVSINTTGMVIATGDGNRYAMAFNLILNAGTVRLHHNGGLFVERTLTRTGGSLACNNDIITNGQGTEFVDASDLKLQVRTENGTAGTAAVIENQYNGTSYTVPASVAFNGVTYTVVEIATAAFQNCTNLTSLTFLGSVPAFGRSVFNNISNTLTITVPAGQKVAYETALEGLLPIGSVIAEVATFTLNLNQQSSWTASGGSEETAWTWDGTWLTLTGVGPYALTGTGTLAVKITANNAVIMLDDAHITAPDGFVNYGYNAIEYSSFNGMLTVNLSGASSLTGGKGNLIGGAGFLTNGSLTFNGSGSLLAKGYSGENGGWGLDCPVSKTLTLQNGAQVTAIGGQGANLSGGGAGCGQLVVDAGCTLISTAGMGGNGNWGLAASGITNNGTITASGSFDGGIVINTINGFITNNGVITATGTSYADGKEGVSGILTFSFFNPPITSNAPGIITATGGSGNPPGVGISSYFTRIGDGTYNVTDGKSTDASLASLTVSEGTLSPAFEASQTSYTVSVDNSVSQITIGGIANHSQAFVTGNTGSKELAIGLNVFNIVVTAEDGTTQQTYSVTVTRATPSGIANEGVSGITISQTQGILYVESPARVLRAVIYNTDGTPVLQPGNFEKGIDVSSLSQGVYLIQIVTSTETLVRKFVKE